MALSIPVAADVTADAFKHLGSSRSSSGASCNGVSRHGLVSNSLRTKRSQFLPNLSTWIRPSSHHTTPHLFQDSGPSGGSSPSATSPTSRRPRVQGQLLLDKAKRRANGLASAGTANDKATSPVEPPYLLNRAPSYTPTTPAFVLSPTSPATPAIPTTPPRLTIGSQSTRTPSLLRYGGFSYDGVIYSTPKYSPVSRRRSSTWSSAASSSSQSFTAMALPIGQKTGRWMEQDFRPAFTPSDTGYYDGDDEEEDYERSFVEDYGGYIEEEDLVEEADESLPTEIHLSPKPLMRPLRSPSGPRRMPNSPSSSPYRGLGLSVSFDAASPTSPLRDHSLDGIYGITDVVGKVRRRSVDSSSTSSASCSDLCERTSTAAVSANRKESRLSATGQVDEHILFDETAAGTDENDYSWEAQDDSYDKINATTAAEPSSTLEIVPPAIVSVSPLRISKRIASSTTSLPSNTEMGASERLAEPFDLKPAEEVEVSTFEWDSDDEAPEGGLRRRLSKLRQAIRDSVSVPSLKPSLRRMSEGSSSSSSTSPESVSSLRARQAASPSPDGHTRLWKLATDVALSPIPGSPVVTPPDTFVPFPEVQSPPTPATPISPDTVEFQSFLYNVFRDGPTVPIAAAARLAAKPSRPPPDLPLPPTPPLLSSPYTPPRLRARENDQGTNQPSPSADQRLTVVDPDTSMARLEVSMAKLEGYAPRLEPRRRAVSDAAVKKKHRSKPSRSQVDVAINIDDTHARETLVPLKPSKAMQPFRLSQSSTSTSDPSSGASTSGGSYARREPAILPVNMKRRRQGDQKKSLRPPSLALLPMFDFEEPGHKVLDIAPDLPPRTASLENRSAGLRLHSQTVFAGVDAESSYSDSQLSLPMTQSYSTDMVDRLGPPNTPPKGPKRSQEGLSSFMHFTPRQSEPRSRVRRLLDRVHVRGLRAPFGPQTQPV